MDYEAFEAVIFSNTLKHFDICIIWKECVLLKDTKALFSSRENIRMTTQLKTWLKSEICSRWLHFPHRAFYHKDILFKLGLWYMIWLEGWNLQKILPRNNIIIFCFWGDWECGHKVSELIFYYYFRETYTVCVYLL